MTWEDPERIGLYVTHLDEAWSASPGDRAGFSRDRARRDRLRQLLRAIELFAALGAHGVRYLPDPGNPYGGIVPGRPTLDIVRLPREPCARAPATATTSRCSTRRCSRTWGSTPRS